MNELAQQIHELAAELKANEAVTVTRWEPGAPASAEDLSRARALGLGDAFLALWQAMDGFDLRWEDVEWGDQVQGGVEVSPLRELLREDREGRVFFPTDPADDPKRSFYPFESFDPYGNGHSCGVVLDGSASPAVFYLSGDPDLHYLAPDLARWVALVRETRGYLYWQSALLDEDRAVEIVQDLPRLFGAEYVPLVAPRG